jgi:hypothetical protein
LVGFVLFLMLVGCGANNATEVPTLTNTPLPTQTPTFTPTKTPRPTNTPIPTQTPIFVMLGLPFASNCGDGIPRIWSNDSFNALGTYSDHQLDEHHGHVDIRPPAGCYPMELANEVIAPFNGQLLHIGGQVYDLIFPQNEYPEGIEDVLRFIGVENPDLRKISNLRISFGHIKVPPELLGILIAKGRPIGDIVDLPNKPQTMAIAYQITGLYNGQQFWVSPTVFPTDGHRWVCVQDSEYDCEPEPNDYVK